MKIGKMGIEKQYEEILQGKPGYRILQVNATGKSLELFRHNLDKPAENGKDILLSIDNELQNYVEELMEPYSKSSSVVLDCSTGEILSYVSKPEYDPNLFMDYISHSDWDALTQNPDNPLLDRVIHATYPPGSVFKTVIALNGLEHKLITPQTKLAYCDGGLQVGDRYVKCWYENGHGSLNLMDAIRFSCDVYFYDLSFKMTLDQINEYSHKLMLFERTGIDLPGEREGFIPTEEWFMKRYGKNISVRGHVVNISIGQGEILTTPLQICAHYAMIANEGRWVQPHFLKKIINTEKHQNQRRYFEKNIPFEAGNIETIKKALYITVNDKWGTGANAKVEGVKVYGKTGSAENHMGTVTHAWFAGFAEWSEPEIAVVVFLENAGSGGGIAAPIAKKIIEKYHVMRGQK
ncbi:MAG: penicillin-binding transpeptidase domain-containing protein [Candidatus Cloacimonetes bacterium]|nr:penicillin-binding transpeptidase domain-containing protein [Candidatus Cloacimonadota bacterium]